MKHKLLLVENKCNKCGRLTNNTYCRNCLKEKFEIKSNMQKKQCNEREITYRLKKDDRKWF